MKKYDVELFYQTAGVTRLTVVPVSAQNKQEAGRMAMIILIDQVEDCNMVSVKYVHLVGEENGTDET
ncbi:hypothetical protein H1164_08160 [Thermoactinomyces daqus]|uniref:Uncharacterized protein n=1 Tax=Thermoactinomyces daqus TaxID=1329516 RepID=A0A7W1XAA8_9BACL|nr:hypothetical protein [Thermoactinomyces daqus]MBA4542873.1 hypothetical protein [Thermoactinomyces daqus]